MTLRRKVEWLLLALTAGLLILLKWWHLGVTHYNVFLLILLAWSLVLILLFKALKGKASPGRDG